MAAAREMSWSGPHSHGPVPLAFEQGLDWISWDISWLGINLKKKISKMHIS